MSDLIRREDAIHIIACEMYAEAQAEGYEVGSVEDYIPEAKAWMSDAPSAEPKIGEWVPNHDGSWNCSECGLRVFVYAKGNFCPNCGADMRGKEK